MKSIIKIALFQIIFLACLMACVYSKKHQRIAIIGGGISGSFLQIQLRKQFGENAEIHVFEKENRLGGRCQSFVYDGKYYELGKQRFTEYDKQIMEYLQIANVTYTKEESPSLGTYDKQGYKFLLNLLTLLRPIAFFYNYPVSSILYMMDYSYNWEKINKLNDEVEVAQYKNLRQFLQANNIEEMIDDAFDKYVNQNYYFIGDSFIQDYLQALNVLIFNQEDSINALAGYSAQFIGAGQSYRLDQGLEQFVNKLYNLKLDVKSKLRINLNTNITLVEKLHPISSQENQFRLHFNTTFEDYDQVVVAYSLEQLENPSAFFSNFTQEEGNFLSNLKQIYYQKTVVTYVRANQPLQSYFGFNLTDNYPQLLVPSESSKSEFIKIKKVNEKVFSDNTNLFEITSRITLTKEQVNKIFGESSRIIKVKEWDALFPHIKKFDTVEIADYEFIPGLYYLHAAEQVIPLLSFEAFSAKIVANLMDPSFKSRKQFQQTSDL